MRSLSPRKYFRAIFIVGLIGIGLWGVLGVAAAQDEPEAPAGSLYLPSISSDSLSGASDLVYDFTHDAHSEAAWTSLTDVFQQYGTSLIRQDTAIDIAADDNGTLRTIATIRCTGHDCGGDAATETTADVQAPEDLTLLVRIDATRSLVFKPISRTRLDLDVMRNSQLVKRISFTCQQCIMQVTVNELYATPTPTRTATATPIPGTPTRTPTPTSTATAVPPTKTPTPKPTATKSSPQSFIETFDGAPASPKAWTAPVWDITVHSRDKETFTQLETMNAHHGSQCEPPLATHSISAYQDAVFQCKDHLMTAIKAGGYGLIYLTPAYQVDFTNGTATVRFDMSTYRSSMRDWTSLYISPMEDHLQLALEEWLPDLSGEPKRGVKIKMREGGDKTWFDGEVFRNHNSSGTNANGWIYLQDVLEPSASTRTTFELQISKTHLKFGMPQYNFWWIDTDIEPLDWTVGVIQFGHHSYSPDKDFPQNCPNSNCTANTWHWDNISINPARPFTMIHATKRFANAATSPTVTFTAPAPANAFLRFAGIGHDIEVSFNGGQSWQVAQVQDQVNHAEEHFWSYFTPIPAGVTSVQFRGKSWYGNPWLVRDMSIWAK